MQKTLKVCLAIHCCWWCSGYTAVAGHYLKEEFHWNTLANKEQHASKTAYIFLNEKEKQIVRIRKEITKFGLDPNELGHFSQERYKEKWDLKQLVPSIREAYN